MRNPSSPDGSQVVFGLGSGKPLQYIYMQLANVSSKFHQVSNTGNKQCKFNKYNE